MTTKIYYKISFPNNTCYIGKTNNLKRRMSEHKTYARYNTHPNKNFYLIYKEFGYEGWSVEWLFIGTGIKEYHKVREHSLIRDTPNTINLNKGQRCLLNSRQEYYQENKEKIKKQVIERASKNRDEINRKQREKRSGPEGDEVRRKEREYNHRKRLGLSK